MGYYDDDYEEPYDGYEECIEPVCLVVEECTEKDITDALLIAGLITEKQPKLRCSMEKLVFIHGEPNEVYSSAEIRFIESVHEVIVYSDFFKKLNRGKMACRVIAAKINYSGRDALRACVSFEKIINKALDGFNVFFFVSQESVLFGCRVFDKFGKSDCSLSRPIQSEIEFEQIQEELSFLEESEDFMDFYNQYRSIITISNNQDDDYETIIIKKRGLQFAYLDEIDKIERDIGVDMTTEKERYWHMFESVLEVSFATLLEEVEESLAFIKSNRVNIFEILFEADEMMQQAEETEAENANLARQLKLENSTSTSNLDEEVEALLDNPEEMIKLLKKRRGI